MDPTQPLNLLPQAQATSPYTAPNSPYQQSGVSNVIAALKAGLGGAQNSTQQQSDGQPPQQAPAGSPSTPNFGQMGGQAVNHLSNLVQALGGSSPSFGGGNILSGDAWGGSAAMPLPGLTAADYG